MQIRDVRKERRINETTPLSTRIPAKSCKLGSAEKGGLEQTAFAYNLVAETRFFSDRRNHRRGGAGLTGCSESFQHSGQRSPEHVEPATQSRLPNPAAGSDGADAAILTRSS